MSSGREQRLECPLCTFETSDSYVLALHVEEKHFAHESPFVTEDDRHASQTAPEPLCVTPTGQASSIAPDQADHDEWLPCQEEECGELVLWKDLPEHLYLHAVELSKDATTPSDTLEESHEKVGLCRRTRDSEYDPRPASPATPPRRLGKEELGPFAFEKQMPQRLFELISQDGKVTIVNTIGPGHVVQREEFVQNKIRHVVPMLANLLDANSSTEAAYLCHPAVQHIFKLPFEGSFCGYRNIQMLITFLQSVPTTTVFPGNARPTILHLQDWIEQAWDEGYFAHGRIETGGIKGTRKFIGTPEVKALFDYLHIANETECCHDTHLPSHTKEQPRIQPAYHHLFRSVELYFASASQHQISRSRKTTITTAGPIYLQLRGHSMTIIGFEKSRNGANLLVFDPSYGPPLGMRKLLGLPEDSRPASKSTGGSWRGSKTAAATSGKPARLTKAAPSNLVHSGTHILEAYRRGTRRFARHKEFELLFVQAEGEGTKET